MNARNTAYTIQRQLDSRRAVLRWQEDQPMTAEDIRKQLAEIVGACLDPACNYCARLRGAEAEAIQPPADRQEWDSRAGEVSRPVIFNPDILSQEGK